MYCSKETTCGSRPHCRVSERLERSLVSYALAASAAGVAVLATAPPIEGSIAYTPTNERITNNTFRDVNNDGE
jgi:hypothetical protein